MRKLSFRSSSLTAAMFACAPIVHRERAVRVDDAAGAEDLLLPLADVDGDVHARSPSAASPARSICSRHSPRPIASPSRRPSSPSIFGLFGLVSGSLWGRKAWGVWWQWDAQPDDGAAARAGLLRLSAGAEVRRARVREAGGGDGHLRRGDRAVHLQVGGHGGARSIRRPRVMQTLGDSRRRCGVLVWFCSAAFHAAVRGAAGCCASPRAAAGGSWTSCIWRHEE